MIRTHAPIVAPRRMAGLSLIEMMIALVMALIVAAGIISVFASTSSSNKVQAQMAVLQEEGRFAIHSLRTDLANANSNYCSNSGGNAGQVASGLFLDSLSSPLVYAKAALVFPDYTPTTPPLPNPTEQYSLPSSLYMRGYDCSTAGCTPLDPASVVADIPPMGTGVGDRVPGTDVLTVRYLRPGSGWAIVPTGGSGTTIDPVSATTSAVATINLDQRPGEDPIANFAAGAGVAMLADCSSAQVFAVTNASGVLAPTGANYTPPVDITRDAAPRVYDFTRDFQTVTYFLQVVCANNAVPCTGTTTGELVRVVNGGVAANGGSIEPLVKGVERLNFRYGVIGADGSTYFLTATQVDAGMPGVTCLLAPPYYTSDVAFPGGMPDTGCLWRAVQSIQVSILMDGQTPLYTLTPAEQEYVYTLDPTGTAMAPPAAHAGGGSPPAGVSPALQGFPDPLLRRQFTALIALRNFNP